jgi:glycosyltransferase involved in cell wall biosynthesis
MSDHSKRISLSVIVPCYNVERYLDRSLACLSRQWNGRTDYEIILVNDASTDNTIYKLNDFKSQFNDNVLVIDKKVNSGSGEARNSGLDVAKGEWVVFFDPDDALADNGYASLLDLAQRENLDILSFGVKDFSENAWNDDIIQTVDQLSVDWTGTGKDFMLNFHYATSIKYLFKRELVMDRRFGALSFLEDLVFVLPLFLSDINVALTKEIIYYYIVRQSSSTNNINPQKMSRGSDDILAAIQFMDLCKQGQSDAIKERIEDCQLFYKYNLITRLMLSDKNLSDLKKHRDAINELLIPRNHSNKKDRLYDYVLEHPILMKMLRPVYRALRKR